MSLLGRLTRKGRLVLRRSGDRDLEFDVTYADLSARRAGKRWLWSLEVETRKRKDMAPKLDSGFFEHPVAGPALLREAVFEFGTDHPTNPSESHIHIFEFDDLRANRVAIERRDGRRFSVRWVATCPDFVEYGPDARDYEVLVEATFTLGRVEVFDNSARVLLVSPFDFQGRDSVNDLQQIGYTAALAKPEEALAVATSLGEDDIMLALFVAPPVVAELTAAMTIAGCRCRRLVVMSDDPSVPDERIAADRVLRCSKGVDTRVLHGELAAIARRA